jgi:kynurenine formamidase
VKRGEVYSLADDIKKDGVPIASERSPAVHLMALDGGDYAAGVKLAGGFYQAADDYLFMACQGTTHIDALSHFWYDDQLYNGHSPNRVRSYGATRLGIENLPSLATRGVLLDIANWKSVERLNGGEVITAADLQDCATASGVEIGPGDCVLIRTGWRQMFFEDHVAYHASSPGIGIDAGRWLAERQITAVGADNLAVEVITGHGKFESGAPGPVVHKLLIRDCGTYMIELLNLEEFSQVGVCAFLFVAAPLKIVGAVGSPINPLAIV